MEYLKYIFKVLLIGFIVLIISNFFVQIAFVDGTSMIPTLKDKQIVLINKFDKKINRGDILLIKKNNKIIIKRVVGLPYDSLIIENEFLYVNGKKYDDRIIKDSGNAKETITLNDDEYYVLGDNRNHSIDSRFNEIGIINYKDIIGKMIIF